MTRNTHRVLARPTGRAGRRRRARRPPRGCFCLGAAASRACRGRVVLTRTARVRSHARDTEGARCASGRRVRVVLLSSCAIGAGLSSARLSNAPSDSRECALEAEQGATARFRGGGATLAKSLSALLATSACSSLRSLVAPSLIAQPFMQMRSGASSPRCTCAHRGQVHGPAAFALAPAAASRRATLRAALLRFVLRVAGRWRLRCRAPRRGRRRPRRRDQRAAGRAWQRTNVPRCRATASARPPASSSTARAECARTARARRRSAAGRAVAEPARAGRAGEPRAPAHTHRSRAKTARRRPAPPARAVLALALAAAEELGHARGHARCVTPSSASAAPAAIASTSRGQSRHFARPLAAHTLCASGEAAPRACTMTCRVRIPAASRIRSAAARARQNMNVPTAPSPTATSASSSGRRHATRSSRRRGAESVGPLGRAAAPLGREPPRARARRRGAAATEEAWPGRPPRRPTPAVSATRSASERLTPSGRRRTPRV